MPKRSTINTEHDTLSATDFEKLLKKCQSLPVAQGDYRIMDYVENLLLTVLDFQMQEVTIRRAIAHYRLHARITVSDYQSLKQLLSQYPNSQEGNRQAAQYLWGYNLWSRVELLRRLLAYFESHGVTTQAQLEQWAHSVDFKRDFEGKVKGAGFAIFKWLVIRQGVETVKPDIWVHRFIRDTVGYSVSDEFAVRTLEAVAREIGIKAYELDWRIWEFQRSNS